MSRAISRCSTYSAVDRCIEVIVEACAVAGELAAFLRELIYVSTKPIALVRGNFELTQLHRERLTRERRALGVFSDDGSRREVIAATGHRLVIAKLHAKRAGRVPDSLLGWKVDVKRKALRTAYIAIAAERFVPRARLLDGHGDHHRYGGISIFAVALSTFARGRAAKIEQIMRQYRRRYIT